MSEKIRNTEEKSSASILVSFLIVIGIALICFATFPVWGFMATDILLEMQDRPAIQEIVREQCNLPTYIADGSFEIGITLYGDYDNDNGEANISCRGEPWQCSCTPN